ncbi:MAG: extracellular solute-binding protein [Limnochordia bacterium]|jgi:multiple sugar transport system substrate-binding protein|nr:extracellular solute-binding protein [Limnochordia bacterium]
MRKMVCISILLCITLLAAAPAFGNERTTIVMAGWAHPDDMKDVIAEFEAKHPWIQVEYRYVEGGTLGYTSAVALWAVGGALPDVLPVPFWSFYDLLEVGALAGLNELIERDQDEVNISDYLPGALEAHQRDGVIYGLPGGLELMTILCNNDLFMEKGLALPSQEFLQGNWSIETMIDAARKLTTENPNGRLDTVGVYMETNQLEFIAPYVWAYGGRIFSDDGFYCLLDSPEALEGIEVLVSLLQEEKAFVTTAQRGHFKADWWDALAGGDAGMLSWWISAAELIRAQGINWQLGLVPFPKGVTNRTNLIAFHSTGVSSTGAHKDEAWELVKFLAGEATPRSDSTGMFARISYMGPWMENMRNYLGVQGVELIGLAQEAMRSFARPVSAKATSIVAELLQRGFLGQLSAPVAVREAVRLAEGVLQEYR